MADATEDGEQPRSGDNRPEFINLATYRASRTLSATTSSDPQAVESAQAGAQASDMDPLIKFRLDQGDKRMDAIDQKLDAIRTTLGEIRLSIATQPTKAEVRSLVFGLGATIIATLVGTMIAIAALMVAASGNQLSAFQAGLSSVQTAVATKPEVSTSTPAPAVLAIPHVAPPAPAPSTPAIPAQPSAPAQRQP